YAEGYPGRRYYAGCQFVDIAEKLAIERACRLFDCRFANVQPNSGSQANQAVFMALMKPGDTFMGLDLAAGGHLTHGAPVNVSGKWFNVVSYGVRPDDNLIDMDAVARLAEEHKPKIIIAGGSAYSRHWDFARFREIANGVGAWLIADISHIAGLVAAGEHQSPVPHFDVVMTTTHKTLRGPRGATILVTERGLARDEKLGKAIDAAIIPGLQGGPHNATTAGIALAAEEAARPEFTDYARRVKRNATALAGALVDRGLTLVGGGTENHLAVIDLSGISPGLGTQVAFAMDVAGMYANRNTIPDEPASAFYPSGVRIGTPLVTTRGMTEPDMDRIGEWIARVVEIVKGERLPAERTERSGFVRAFRERYAEHPELLRIREEVKKLAEGYPLFRW
ncbi:MAG: serine hydroxymethyltransferase, partial [Spirochaetota bacterium]